MNQQHDNMVNRIKGIYQYMKRNHFVSSTELADEFGYGQRTIQRDLKVLEHNRLVINVGRGKWKLV